MKDVIKKVPIPLCGVMLGAAALGNLLQSYSEGIRYVCGVFAAFLLILALLMFCQRFPQWWNYPVEVTEENREHIFEIASKMMSVIKLLSIGVCLYAGISGNLGTAPMWPVWILIAGIFVTLLRGIRGIYKAGKETGMDEDDKS